MEPVVRGSDGGILLEVSRAPCARLCGEGAPPWGAPRGVPRRVPRGVPRSAPRAPALGSMPKIRIELLPPTPTHESLINNSGAAVIQRGSMFDCAGYTRSRVHELRGTAVGRCANAFTPSSRKEKLIKLSTIRVVFEMPRVGKPRARQFIKRTCES